ncbi:protein NLRC3 [Oryzias melastigma]|uniref:protein NLRC3 n=1 Tax=Oryzias melastigma TaxID=30732 RepID=UPI000CF7FDB8|nr:protein NLRC3 [Oryzias melastigma]XP_024121360.1 protein NLRC3 [Oryzias melastigma]
MKMSSSENDVMLDSPEPCVEMDRSRSEPAGSEGPPEASDSEQQLPPEDQPAASSNSEASEDLQRKRRAVLTEERPSCCALCQDVLKDPLCLSCGHWFCRRCITSHRRQSAAARRSCFQCAAESDSGAGIQTWDHSGRIHSECWETLKLVLRNFMDVFNLIPEDQIFLKDIFIDLHVSEARNEHQRKEAGASSRKKPKLRRSIQMEDVLKPGRDTSARIVLTKGAPGVGKSILTQKFTLDWAGRRDTEDIHFVFPFKFKMLNKQKDLKRNFVDLLHDTFGDIKDSGITTFDEFRILLILDGLDECQLPLDFKKNETLSDVCVETSLDVLLTNLIKGNLLPLAQIWITTRPAAAARIPAKFVGLVTEIRGFSDANKEAYFRKRIKNKEQASRVISHVRAYESLYRMCHLPNFCRITVKVLEDKMKTGEEEEFPKNIGDMYINFLLLQSKRNRQKYPDKAEKYPDMKKVIQVLGKLAFEQLQKGHLIFYASHMVEYGISVKDAPLFSDVLTNISRKRKAACRDPAYCFIRLRTQEFLAAVYVFNSYRGRKTEMLQDLQEHLRDGEHPSESPRDAFVSKALLAPLQSKNRHLDLFVCFLHGLSVQFIQNFLKSLIGRPDAKSEVILTALNHLKKMSYQNLLSDQSLSIYHTLMHVKELSLPQHIQRFLKLESKSEKELLEVHVPLLIHMMHASEDELYLKKYNVTKRTHQRLKRTTVEVVVRVCT